jgi:hypothetical protein
MPKKGWWILWSPAMGTVIAKRWLEGLSLESLKEKAARLDLGSG